MLKGFSQHKVIFLYLLLWVYCELETELKGVLLE